MGRLELGADTPRKVGVPERGELQPGVELTPKDMEVLRWIGLNGLVTVQQVARQFYIREGGRVGVWAAYKRIGKLEKVEVRGNRILLWERTPNGRHRVLRLTRRGLHRVGLDLPPAQVVTPEHDVAVVDLLQHILSQNPGTRVITERQLRHEWPDLPRRPDALLRLASGQIVAVELDRTSKRSVKVTAIIDAFRRQQYDRVWWYCRPGEVTARVAALVRRHNAADFIEVRPWPFVVV